MEIFTRPVALILTKLVRLYQVMMSPFIAPSCRHYPSCSAYCIEAINTHGPIKGVYLSLRRLLRCRPGGTYGNDPVPKKKL